MGCHFLLQGIFLTQRSNPGLLSLLHWQADFLSLSHLGSLRHSVTLWQCLWTLLDCRPWALNIADAQMIAKKISSWFSGFQARKNLGSLSLCYRPIILDPADPTYNVATGHRWDITTIHLFTSVLREPIWLKHHFGAWLHHPPAL